MKYDDKLKQHYESQWTNCVIDYQPDEVRKAAGRLFALKPHYEGFFNVPWWFIALCHLRECNNNFKGCLHNGDPIIGTGHKTSHVPAGRGPFSTWPEATRDALRLEGLDREQDFSIGKSLYRLEGFNGYGYLTHGRSSPYLWSHTNWYADSSDASQRSQPHGGKYVSDGKWADVIDHQLGVCAILKELQKLDPSIFASTSAPATSAPAPTPEPAQEEPPAEEPDADEPDDKPEPKSPETPTVVSPWAATLRQAGIFIASLGGLLTDWRTAAVIVVGGIAGYAIWNAHGRPAFWKGQF